MRTTSCKLRILAIFGVIVAGMLAVVGLLALKVRFDDTRELQQPWPMALGPLAAVPQRFLPQPTNASALHLIEDARPLRIDFRKHMAGETRVKDPIHDVISTYVASQVAHTDDTIDPPPVALEEYFTAQAVAMGAIRSSLLGAPPAWEIDLSKGVDAPLPNLLAHLQLSRCFIARALVMRDGDDLRAAWVLSRDLWRRPELLCRLIAFAETRMISAAMRKLPPVPDVRDALRALDVRRGIVEGIQTDAWMMHQMFISVSLPLGRPAAADSATAIRKAATEIALSRNCAVDPRRFRARVEELLARWNVMGRVAAPDFGGFWARAARFVAEREATDRILAIKADSWTPALEHSDCPDGTWIYADGKLRFSRDIASTTPAFTVPLSYAKR